MENNEIIFNKNNKSKSCLTRPSFITDFFQIEDIPEKKPKICQEEATGEIPFPNVLLTTEEALHDLLTKNNEKVKIFTKEDKYQIRLLIIGLELKTDKKSDSPSKSFINK